MTVITIKYKTHNHFDKDFKKLLKKFRTLEADLEKAKRFAIELFHIQKIDNNSIVKLQGYIHEKVNIYKLRKFACQSLKGKGAMSGIRIIYAYHLEKNELTFLEVYYKANQVNETSERIELFIKQL